MHIQDWKKDVFTVPNLLSLLRLLLIPVYITLYLRAVTPEQYQLAAMIIALSCLTDALDGMIARRWNMISILGKVLDPAADKLTQFALTVCLSLRYPPLKPVLFLFLVKEILQLVLGAAYLHRGKILPGALMTGKVCTTVLFFSLTGLVLFPQVPSAVVTSLAIVNFFFLAISFASYLSAYLGKHPILQDLNPDRSQQRWSE